MCEKVAKYRYTWPGRDEDFICDDHVDWLKQIANTMGLHLQVLPIEESEIKCSQKTG
tara:strand:- start:1694 stop:1864 length:171 start_codon:yes stop_codon:yes gene_type:complete